MNDRTLASRALLVLVCCAALSAPWNAVRVSGLPVGDLLLGAAIVMLVIRSALGGPALRGLRWWMLVPSAVCVILLIVHVLAGGSLTETVTPGRGVAPGLFTARAILSTAGVACCAVFATATGGLRSARHVLAWWYLGVVTSAAVAVLQALGVWHAPLELDQTLGLTPGAERQAGLASHPNALAHSLAIAIPAGVLLAAVSTGMRRAAALAGLAVLLVGEASTRSRAGLILTAVALVLVGCWLLWRRRHGVLIIPFIIVVSGGIVVSVPFLLEHTRFGSEGSIRSDTTRLAALEEGWRFFSGSPLIGSGPGVWFGESALLILLASGGVVLALAYLVFLGVPTMMFACSLRAPAGFLGLTTVVVTVVSWTMNNGLLERVAYWPILLAAAALTATAERSDDVTRSRPRDRAR
ncbi:O-antigen ligase family protein [Agromyces archimandritae]|uniref:O-antigen ligase-related domain-containing protein n=1 Tax=Agromyces archimandritae TaxID=2781962 RepID=A0A975FMY4_9MICO|nr:O-antigen ligase family protein [Agromyces archimandritae]QTX05433.1 hypothetical protein G127AT_04240 [Agromyces archimandritae]